MAVKERSILFSGAMVRAIRAGLKSQTRRVVKVAHIPAGTRTLRWENQTAEELMYSARCPYGVVGDRLWVKSAHWYKPASDLTPEMVWHPESGEIVNRQNGQVWTSALRVTQSDVEQYCGGFKKRPSIHMPRWASRLLLEITSLRVERVRAISEADARAEGIIEWSDPPRVTAPRYGVSVADVWESTARGAFLRLFFDINERAAPESDPWVWVVGFKVVEGGATQQSGTAIKR